MQGQVSGSETHLRAVELIVGEQRWALPLDAVERVLAMVAFTALPASPIGVRGAINMHGRPVAVLDLELRLGRPLRTYGTDAKLVLVRTPRRRLALPVDEVPGVVSIDRAAIGPADAGMPAPVGGVAALEDGVLLISDVEAFLTAAEDEVLAAALDEMAT